MARTRIFLAEDNPADIVLVREALDDEGLACDLVVAEDGSIALHLLEKMGHETACPDIAIIDLNLPKVDGTELLRAIRTNHSCSNLPVLVMTSSRSPRDLRVIESLGARYFHKPLELAEYFKIGKVVVEMLSARAAASTSA